MVFSATFNNISVISCFKKKYIYKFSRKAKKKRKKKNEKNGNAYLLFQTFLLVILKFTLVAKEKFYLAPESDIR